MGLEYPKLIFSDPKGKVFSHPFLSLAGRSGDRFILPHPSELVSLPRGSQLFTMPGRIPVGWDEEKETFVSTEKAGIRGTKRDCSAVAAFLPPGYVRTLLPATRKRPEAPLLPLWAYSAVGWKDGAFWATGLFLDPNPHWNPAYFQNNRLLERRIEASLKTNPNNRLLRQLSRCALEYHCFAAKNVFLRRWECPLPSSPSCNAKCLGCISLQPSECCPASQERIQFVPTLGEIIEVALPHLEHAEDSIVSFGQGCEGEPLMQWSLLKRSIRKLRERTGRGTINMNTNGSLPERVIQLCDAGLDSIRITLNSARSQFYHLYHRPKGYAIKDVLRSLIKAKEKDVYTSLNLLTFPGFTDCEEEAEHLIRLIQKTRIDLIQMRNLNIDPDLYLRKMGGTEGMGIPALVSLLRREFPKLQFGYFNRTRDSFHPTAR